MALPQGNVSLPFDACTTLRWDTLPHNYKLHTFVCNMMKTTTNKAAPSLTPLMRVYESRRSEPLFSHI